MKRIHDSEQEDYYPQFDTMCTIGRNEKFYIIVAPNEERHYSYFKVYNNPMYHLADKVIDIDFRESIYYTHGDDKKYFWEIRSGETKELIKFLKSRPPDERSLVFDSFWKYAIHCWNIECWLTEHPDYDDSYPEGCCPDSDLFKDPQFVPLNAPIPNYTKIKYKGDV